MAILISGILEDLDGKDGDLVGLNLNTRELKCFTEEEFSKIEDEGQWYYLGIYQED